MNLVFYIPILFFSVFTWAESKWPAEMPLNCAKEISQHQDVRDGSVSSSQTDIMDGLKYDWKIYPDHFKAVYSDCGPSDFFFIEVDKSTCKVIDVGSGDSDGECEM